MSGKSALLDAAKPIRSAMSRVIDEIECRLNSEDCAAACAVYSGWFEEHADLVVSRTLFGRIMSLTSKTAFSASRNAMQLSTSSFARNECNVLYVSRTLQPCELACNLMAEASSIDVDRLASGRLADPEWDRLEIAIGQMLGQQFSALHTDRVELPLLRDWLRYASSKFESTPLVVIDDAVLLLNGNRNSNYCGQRELLEISKLASSVDALIVLVGQTWAH